MEPTERSWSLNGVDFTLELWPGKVFIPTTVSELMAKNLGMLPAGAVVIDMGCGAGFFAVLATKMGASKVYAVDVMREAVELTKRNVERNGVADRVDVRCGSLFEPIADVKADLILIDVSGIPARLSRLTPWYPGAIATASEDGTEPTITALKQARDHLLPGGRLLFASGSLQNEKPILQAAQALFQNNLQLLYERIMPVTEQLRAALDQCIDLIDRGIISLVERHGKNYWWLRIHEASVR